MEIPFVVLADHDVREIDASWSGERKADEGDRNRTQDQWNRADEQAFQ